MVTAELKVVKICSSIALSSPFSTSMAPDRGGPVEAIDEVRMVLNKLSLQSIRICGDFQDATHFMRPCGL